MQNYSNIQKFLHDFVLSKKFINKSLFEIEKMFELSLKYDVNIITKTTFAFTSNVFNTKICS